MNEKGKTYEKLRGVSREAQDEGVFNSKICIGIRGLRTRVSNEYHMV